KHGLLLFYNDKVSDIWNESPSLYSRITSLKWYKPDGTALAEDQHPSSVALQCQRSFHNERYFIESRGGSRRIVVVNIDPVYDSNGELVGVLNIFKDITNKQEDIVLGRLTAIAESSDDAII